MAQLPSVGVTAQILTHVRFDREPVVQTRRRGRLPRSVPNVWRYGYEKRAAAYQERLRQEEIEKTRLRIQDHEYIANHYRHHLSVLSQTKGTVNV